MALNKWGFQKSLREFTVQEVLNKRYIKSLSKFDRLETDPWTAASFKYTDPWRSVRCFNRGTTNYTANTSSSGSAAGSGSMSGGLRTFGRKFTRCDGVITGGAATIDVANVGTDGISSFPKSGKLYTVTWVANRIIPIQISYTGKNSTQFIGCTWSISTSDLADKEVLSLYREEDGSRSNAAPRGLEVKFSNSDGYIKFGNTDYSSYKCAADTIYNFEELDDFDDIFFANGTSGSGTDASLDIVIWY